jgi:palmitoyltransferase ZDHHC3/7/25
MKFFFLFLIYTWSCSVFALVLLGWNYFFCATEECMFNLVLTQLVRIMTMLGVGTFLFTSSMLMNVVYGLLTGIGTIDRLKKKASNTMNDSDEEPVPLKDVFGIGPLWTWPLPIDPLFDDFDRVMGYTTPQRLLREQILREKKLEMTSPV